MEEFVAWGDWSKEGAEHDARKVKALDAESAAQEYVSENFANLDYPDEQDVTVRDSKGVETQWVVNVHSEPVFIAHERRTAKR